MEKKMAQNTNRTLMSYCPDIKVLDCTLRDGGLVNNFRFDDKFVKDLYRANIKAGVDYMEFGYKASKEIFDVKDFGKWKFCDEEDIRAIVGENDTDLKISVMTNGLQKRHSHAQGQRCGFGAYRNLHSPDSHRNRND